ncbi:mRNA-decapping enzyme 1B isoform X2 [Ornithorhynchus anatinus]|uniref:mRNA-decapping enzyme 1B isoform X2 n=1 Tax=Ornithorhynchus anatinus TaxID=9258 RepID=UPI0010A7D36B|nr:mRNA-decapping enzyme 1B isoform X2 [Ornithorhynchus anatinus]
MRVWISNPGGGREGIWTGKRRPPRMRRLKIPSEKTVGQRQNVSHVAPPSGKPPIQRAGGALAGAGGRLPSGLGWPPAGIFPLPWLPTGNAPPPPSPLQAVSIYGIWFYDKEECQRIAELMKNLTQYEQLRARQGPGAGISPMSLSARDGKEVDILQMLTKAKDEYTKCKRCSEPKQIANSSAIYDNPNLIKPIPVKPSENHQQQQQQLTTKQGQVPDPEPQHLSLTALFGKQERAVFRDSSEPPQDGHPPPPERLPGRQGVVRSLSYEEPAGPSPPTEKQLCPAIQKLMVRSADLLPVPELPESRLGPGVGGGRAGGLFPGLFQPVAPQSAGPPPAATAPGPQSLLDQLQAPQLVTGSKPEPAPAPLFGRTAPPAPLKGLAQAPLLYFNGSLPTQALGKDRTKLPGAPPPPPPVVTATPLSGSQGDPGGAAYPQELLKKLQMVQQDQQLPGAAARPALAAKFPLVTQSTRPLEPLDSWTDKSSRPDRQAPLFQVISPQRIPATVAPALLMSPMVFSQPSPAPVKATESVRLPLPTQEPQAGTTGLLLPLTRPDPVALSGSSLTKLQLQETLLNLLQNDDNFLTIIYEAYLFGATRPARKKTL